MKWLSNTYDPKKEDAAQVISCLVGESRQEAWERYQGWLKGKTIGPPKATSACTVERLRQMDMVGVYAEEELGEYDAQPS